VICCFISTHVSVGVVEGSASCRDGALAELEASWCFVGASLVVVANDAVGIGPRVEDPAFKKTKKNKDDETVSTTTRPPQTTFRLSDFPTFRRLSDANDDP